MPFLFAIFISMLITVNAQRSPYAGPNRGSGYKDRYVPSSSTDTATNDIGNRLGEGSTGSTTSTQRLPYDAYGDQYIVDHWNSLPVEQRPFWIVNQQAIEAQRGTPPTTSAVTSGSTTAARPSTNPEFVNRFGPGDTPQKVTGSIPNVQFQEVVYPSNITPEQQLNMEIQFLQQRLDALIERRRQNQSQNVKPEMEQQQQQLVKQQQNLMQQQRKLQSQRNL